MSADQVLLKNSGLSLAAGAQERRQDAAHITGGAGHHKTRKHMFALQSLLKEHGEALKVALMKRFRAPPPDPDDAIQSAILKFLEIERSGSVRNVRAFLYALSRNLMLDELRKMKVRASYRDQEILDSEGVDALEPSTPESVILHRERYILLNRAIASLDADARQLVVLSRIENLSYAEISKRTGRSPAYISRSIQKSLKILSEFLTRNGLGDD